MILAETGSEWDNCDFAIIHVNEEWCLNMRKRLALLETVDENDNSFCSLRYWDSPVGFYRKDTDEVEDLTEGLLEEGEIWCYITFEANEPASFPVPENALGTSTLSIYRHGTAMYSSIGKHTGEEFWTEGFDADAILNHDSIRSLTVKL